MGFFSWLTNDTKRSISNRHSTLDTFTVHMKDNKGNIWTEYDYNGYGMFGKKDYYELVAEMNGFTKVQDPYPELREIGIELVYNAKELGVDRNDVIFPILVEDKDIEWTPQPHRGCEYQGFFYGDFLV